MSDTDLLAPISPDLAAQRGIPQNKVPRRGPLGPHAAGRRRGAGRAAGRPARDPAPRHRQAGDVRRRPFHRSRRGRRRLAGAFLDRLRRRAPSATGSSSSSATTCSATSPTGPTRPSAGSSPRWGIGPGALEELLELREADNVGSGLPAEAGRLASSGHGSRHSWRPRSCSIAPASRSTAPTS